MIDREEEMILEDGDYFQVRWQTIHRSYSSLPENINSFVFQKDKDQFVGELLANTDVTSIEVGTFIKIK